jgi:hypothetical protein
MKHSRSAIGCVAFACMLAQPAAAWARGGTAGAAGHWGAGANGHEASGTYATTSRPTHHATTPSGGSVEAGHANSASYGATTYGARYAIGSYGGVVAANDGHVVTISTGPYAYGTHAGGGAAVTPAAVVVAGPGYAVGGVYAAVPVGYAYRPIGGNAYYFRDGIWFSPQYGAHGMVYRVFPPP